MEESGPQARVGGHFGRARGRAFPDTIDSDSYEEIAESVAAVTEVRSRIRIGRHDVSSYARG